MHQRTIAPVPWRRTFVALAVVFFASPPVLAQQAPVQAVARDSTHATARRPDKRGATPWANFAKYFANPQPNATVVASAAKALPANSLLPPHPSAPVDSQPVQVPDVAKAGAPNVAPVVVAAANPATAPRPVDIGFGTLKFNGWIQAWYSDGTGVGDNTFRLRRAEMRIVGQVSPKVSWVFQFDAAKALSVNNSYTTAEGKRVLVDQSISQGSRMLQDAFVTIAPRPTLFVDVGQFRIPLTYEGGALPWKIETVEQPMFVSDRGRGGGYANVRDVGVMVRGSATKRVDYFVGAFNSSGESQNAQDRNDQKAVIGRVLLRPRLAGLQLGASGVVGGAPTVDRPRRDRAAVEAQYAGKRVTLRSEFIRGVDADVHRAGYYVYSGYRVRPWLEAVARLDTWDPNVRDERTTVGASAREMLVGFNQYLVGNNAKVQVNLTRRSYAKELLPTLTMVLVNVQTAW